MSVNVEQYAERPVASADDPVYSNFDHEFDENTVRLLVSRPGSLCALHAAEEYYGWVWLAADGRWVEQVWRQRAPIAQVEGELLSDVIRETVQRFGRD